MRNITMEILRNPPVEEHVVELVERKGVGHPDYICDGICDAVSVALSKEYLKRFGAIMHHNIDKGLLVAGRVEHIFGGGKFIEPMKFVFGDRATFRVGKEEVPVNEITISTAKKWLRKNLRFVDPEKHMGYQVELKEGSAELRGIFERRKKILGANDTSAAVGYAPLSQTEKLVLETEKFINSKKFKKEYPETGEDVKVMGIRNGKVISLTIAVPFIERYLKNEVDYFRKKGEVLKEVEKFVVDHTDMKTEVYINTLDRKGAGINGVYLSLLGTSAEDADCGQVGRGNRVNGVIALNRPMGTEAAAGKNPVSHVGKIYNVLSHKIANEIYNGVDDLQEVYVWLCSQIGRPIDQPMVAAVQVIPKPTIAIHDMAMEITEIVDRELAQIDKFCKQLAVGKYPIC